MAKHLDLSAIPPSFSTAIDPDFGIQQDLSDSGVLHRRGLFGGTYYLVTLQWDLLTVSQRQTLEWFFTQEAKLETITFTLDGHDYTAELIAGPTRRYVTGTLYGLTVTLRGTRVDSVPTPDPIAEIIAQYTQASHWYDPSDLSTLWQDTAGTIPAQLGKPVARVDDKGNLQLPATQSVAANQPILQKNSSGRLYLDFDSTDFLIVPTGMPVPTTGSCAVVGWRYDTLLSGDQRVYLSRGAAFDAGHRHPMFVGFSLSQFAIQFGNQSHTTIPGSVRVATDYHATAYLAPDNVARESYVNGLLIGSGSAITLTDAGDNPTGQIGGNIGGRIYGVVHIQHGITDEHRRAIESAMAAKAGVGI